MKSHYELIKTRVLTAAVTIFLAVSIMGCNDSIVADMEAEHLRLGNEAKLELQKCSSVYHPVSQTESLHTAP